MNRKVAVLTLVAAAALAGGYVLTRPRDTATGQQAIDLVRASRSGKATLEQQAVWLCRLLDGQTSGGVAYAPHECGWQAIKIAPFRWRVQFQDRGMRLDGTPTAADKLWMLDTKSLALQPRTIATLMMTAPELTGELTNQESADRFIDLTGKPFEAHAATLNQEIDSLPWWLIGPDGVLTRRR